MSLVGFKRMTIRVLDGKAPSENNLYVIEGAESKGATQTAKINGLAAESTKTYGSNGAYHVQSQGVGDVKADITTVDIPQNVKNAILGYAVEGNIINIGEATNPPYCSVLFESSTPAGETVFLGLYKGKFAMEELEFETLKDKQEELPSESLTFSAIASDAEETRGQVLTMLISKDEAEISKVKKALAIEAK